MRRKNFKVKGQSLIEVVVALAIVLLVVIALVQAVTTSIKSADHAKKTAQAASYAQEGMENIRAYRDASWAIFWDDANDAVNHGLAGTVPSGACPSPSTPNLANTFSRCAKLERVDATPGREKAKVTLTVSWLDSKGTHKSELISYFTKWQ